MNRKSRKEPQGKQAVRKAAEAVRTSTSLELRRLAADMGRPVDTSDIPERKCPCRRVVRDSRGHIVNPGASILRGAILAEMERRALSGHELWKKAREHCGTIPESAVYEFLSGKRQVGLAYLDAMLEAMDMAVAPRH